MKSEETKVLQTIDTARQKIKSLEECGVTEYSEEYDMEFSYIGNSLRKALELFSEEVLRKYQIPCDSNATLFEKIGLIRKTNIFTDGQLGLFEKIRYIGNGAVHTNNAGYPNIQTLKVMAGKFLRIVKTEEKKISESKDAPLKTAEHMFHYYYEEDMSKPDNVRTLKQNMNNLIRALSFSVSQMTLENEDVCSRKEISAFYDAKKAKEKSVEHVKELMENSKKSDDDILRWAANEKNVRRALTLLYGGLLDNAPVEECDPFAYKFLLHDDIFVDETLEEYDVRKEREKQYRGIGRFETVEAYTERMARERAEYEHQMEEKRAARERREAEHRKKVRDRDRREIGGVFRYLLYLAINLPLNYFVFKWIYTILDTLAKYYGL